MKVVFNDNSEFILPEAVLYQSMRGGFLQKALQEMGSKTKVVNPKQFLEELEDQQNN